MFQRLPAQSKSSLGNRARSAVVRCARSADCTRMEDRRERKTHPSSGRVRPFWQATPVRRARQSHLFFNRLCIEHFALSPLRWLVANVLGMGQRLFVSLGFQRQISLRFQPGFNLLRRFETRCQRIAFVWRKVERRVRFYRFKWRELKTMVATIIEFVPHMLIR